MFKIPKCGGLPKCSMSKLSHIINNSMLYTLLIHNTCFNFNDAAMLRLKIRLYFGTCCNTLTFLFSITCCGVG